MLQQSPIHAYIPVRDVPRARAFYENTLGLQPGEQIEGGVAYECAAGTSVFLYQTPLAGTSKASQAFWQVDDLEAEMAELRRRGVTFQEYELPGVKTTNGIATSTTTKAAWFKDTEGNILAIVQSLKPTPRARRRVASRGAAGGS